MLVTLLVVGEAAFSSASIVLSGVDAMLLIAGVWITVPDSNLERCRQHQVINIA